MTKTRDPRVQALSLGARYLLDALKELSINGRVGAIPGGTLAETIALAVGATLDEVAACLGEIVRREIATLEHETLTFRETQSHTLRSLIDSGRITPAEAAQRLGVSRATLFRRLSQEVVLSSETLVRLGVSYRETQSQDSLKTVSDTVSPESQTQSHETSPGSSSPPTPVPSSLSHSLSIPTPVTPSPSQTPPQRAREEKQGNLDLEETTRGEAVRLAEVIQGCRVLGPVTLRPVEFALELLKPDAFPGINLFAAVLDCERWCQEADKPTKDGRRRISNWLKKERIEASQRNVLSFVSPTQNRLPLKRTDNRDDPNWTPPEHPAMARWRAEMAAKAKSTKAQAAS